MLRTEIAPLLPSGWDLTAGRCWCCSARRRLRCREHEVEIMALLIVEPVVTRRVDEHRDCERACWFEERTVAEVADRTLDVLTRASPVVYVPNCFETPLPSWMHSFALSPERCQSTPVEVWLYRRSWTRASDVFVSATVNSTKPSPAIV
jgi:hypothetical protein